jgi:Cell division protein CrgA
VPESKNTNDTTDEAVEPDESTADATEEVVEKDVTDDVEVEGELVDVPEELKEDPDSTSEDDDEAADDEADVPAAVAAGTETKDKKDKATKIADDKKPGKKPGKTVTTVKPPKVKKAEKAKKSGPAPRKVPKQRRWVAPLMLACWLIGLAWLVVFYVAGNDIPYMKDLNNWNLLIGMGHIALGFVVSTQWV